VEQAPKKRRGVNRLLFLIVLVGSIFACRLIPAIMPHIQLAAEPLTETPLFSLLGQEFHLTNTMVALIIADVVLIILALSIRRQIKKGSMVLTGISGAFAAILEGFYTMTESTAGKWAKKIFPFFATIFLLVLIVNLMELLPGIDTIGILRPVEPGHHGYAIEPIVGGVYSIKEVEHLEAEDASHEESAITGEVEHSEDTGHEADTHAEGESHETEGGHGEEALFGFFPFVRVASTDLNFTLSLALISVVMTQVIGFQALGRGYLTKYWNTHNLKKAWRQPQFGNPMDFIISIFEWIASVLEIVAEFSKIISFTFRLFGVIFAGSVLLFFIGSMIGTLGQTGVLFLELLFGPLQAFVFGMLTMVFMSLATHSHGPGDEEH
jgi:F-type H+-transporting ATPase subunit a